MSNFTELDSYLFGQATHYDIFRKLGAHQAVVDGVEGVVFDVWAPHAAAVSVVGDFNGWNENAHVMERVAPGEMGVYEAFVPEAREGQLYKYLVYTKGGERLYKADPFATSAELRPETASKIFFTDGYKWTDNAWIKKREDKTPYYEKPMAIYEVHPGSWKRHPGREDDGFYS